MAPGEVAKFTNQVQHRYAPDAYLESDRRLVRADENSHLANLVDVGSSTLLIDFVSVKTVVCRRPNFNGVAEDIDIREGPAPFQVDPLLAFHLVAGCGQDETAGQVAPFLVVSTTTYGTFEGTSI